MSIDIHHIIAFHVVFVGCKVRVPVRMGMRMRMILHSGVGIGIGVVMPIALIVHLQECAIEVEMYARHYP